IGVNASFFYDYEGNYNGIFIDHASGNQIGVPGTDLQSGLEGRNVISGNNNDGILIEGGGNNQVLNSYVGADFFGNLITDQFLSFNLYNVGNGINIDGSSNNTIGAPIGANNAFNVVSGNFLDGIVVQPLVDSVGTITSPASNNIILNNRIGTDASGQNSN